MAIGFGSAFFPDWQLRIALELCYRGWRAGGGGVPFNAIITQHTLFPQRELC